LSAVNQSEAQRLQQVHASNTFSSPCCVPQPPNAQELEEKMDETNATAQEVRGKLKAMESANKDDKPGSSEARIRQNMQVTLAKKFMDLMSECVPVPA
jgi:hypothetical protein